MPSSIRLYINDCDSVYQRALQAGGTSVMEVTDIIPFNGERFYGGVKRSEQAIFGGCIHVKEPFRSKSVRGSA